MRVFVTGAKGLLGSTLCRLLLAEGHTVRGLVRPSSNRRSLEGMNVELVEGDLTHDYRPSEAPTSSRLTRPCFRGSRITAYLKNATGVGRCERLPEIKQEGRKIGSHALIIEYRVQTKRRSREC